MNKKTAQALERSIAHWNRLATGTAREGEGLGARSCSLCTLFSNPDCCGCPVNNHTGNQRCVSTPYNVAFKVFHSTKGFASLRFQKAAAKERDFLISLREDGG